MSEKAEEALAGNKVYIEGFQFMIKKDMRMRFNGKSCNIKRMDGSWVQYGEGDGEVVEDVKAGDECYVLSANISFESDGNNISSAKR